MKKQPTTNMAEYLTVKEVLDKMDIGRTLLYKLFKQKTLPKYKLGGKTYVAQKDLKKIVRACS